MTSRLLRGVLLDEHDFPVLLRNGERLIGMSFEQLKQLGDSLFGLGVLRFLDHLHFAVLGPDLNGRVITPQSSGSIWLNRGYLVPAFESVGVPAEEIDNIITSTWPSASAGAKGFYYTVTNPAFSEYHAFADALFTLIQRRSSQ